MTVRYRSLRRYKYQTLEPAEFLLGFLQDENVTSHLGWVTIRGDVLRIRKGYAWNGASGPTFDTPSTMDASLAHDALYQLMREQLLPQSYRLKADEVLRQVAIAEGMPAWRARAWVWALKVFGASAARPPKKP